MLSQANSSSSGAAVNPAPRSAASASALVINVRSGIVVDPGVCASDEPALVCPPPPKPDHLAEPEHPSIPPTSTIKVHFMAGDPRR